MSYRDEKTIQYKNDCISLVTKIQGYLKVEKFSNISLMSENLGIHRNLLQGMIKTLIGLGIIDVKVSNSVTIYLTKEGEELILTPIQEKV